MHGLRSTALFSSRNCLNTLIVHGEYVTQSAARHSSHVMHDCNHIEIFNFLKLQSFLTKERQNEQKPTTFECVYW